jgi:hypothetical protein
MAKIKVNFEGIPESSGGYDVSAGRHVAEVVNIDVVDGKNTPSGFDLLKWQLRIVDGIDKGKLITHRTSLKPEALFSLRDSLIACGLAVPKSALTFDPDKLKGRKLGIEVIINADGYSNVKRTFLPKVDEDDDAVIME